jgi:hypothetical protein
MKITMACIAAFALSLSATPAFSADAENDGGVDILKGGKFRATASSGRQEIRYCNNTNSFSGTAHFDSWAEGHTFVQIIENTSSGGRPILLINTDGSGHPRQYTSNSSKSTCDKVTIKKGASVDVSAKVDGKNVSIQVGQCSFSGKATTSGAYIKFGSYTNTSNGKKFGGTQTVTYSDVKPSVKIVKDCK